MKELKVRPDGGAIAYGSVPGEDSYSGSVTFWHISKTGEVYGGGGTYDGIRFTSAGELTLWPDGSYGYSIADMGGASPVVFGNVDGNTVEYKEASLVIEAFGEDKLLTTSCCEAVIQRFNRDGTLDQSFGKNGKVREPFYVTDFLIQPQRGILITDDRQITRLYP